MPWVSRILRILYATTNSHRSICAILFDHRQLCYYVDAYRYLSIYVVLLTFHHGRLLMLLSSSTSSSSSSSSIGWSNAYTRTVKRDAAAMPNGIDFSASLFHRLTIIRGHRRLINNLIWNDVAF